jgi:hypothetical protein
MTDGDLSGLILKIVGNLFLIVLVIRAFQHYLKKEWGELWGHIAVSVILIGFIYFTDQVMTILKSIWTMVEGWFA